MRLAPVFATLCLSLSLALTGCPKSAKVEGPVARISPRVSGPASTTVDLLRPFEQARDLYVEVDVGLERPAFFLVDTGASLTAISGNLASALSLEPSAEPGFVHGLGGLSRLRSTRVPEMQIGDMTLKDVFVAVDIAGMPRSAGLMPVDGILGSNVLSSFTVALDFPGATLTLARPGRLTLPESAPRMYFDGSHCFVDLDMSVGSDSAPVVLSARLPIDTGGKGVVLAGAAAQVFAGVASEGDEIIVGIGGEGDLPMNAYSKPTRHVPLRSLNIGGYKVPSPGTAVWINWAGSGETIGPESMPGFIGYEPLASARLVMDYERGRYTLEASSTARRFVDGHSAVLEQEMKTHGDDLERAPLRARLLAVLDREDESAALLERYLVGHPQDSAAAVFLARVRRNQGKIDAYWQAISNLDPGALTREGEILQAVSGHIVAGRLDRARSLAESAVSLQARDEQAWVAMAEVRLASGDHAGARAAIQQANHIGENPNGYLLRRARIALAEGDRAAALAHLRQLLVLRPSMGFGLWFYSAVAVSPQERQALAQDMQFAMNRLHPEDQPVDFMLSVHRLMGNEQRVGELLAIGLERECGNATDDHGKANCEAWLLGLAGRDLDRALVLSQGAVNAHPSRSDYLDTLALVQRRAGQKEESLKTARKAVNLDPSDIYLLWQSERLAAGQVEP